MTISICTYTDYERAREVSLRAWSHMVGTGQNSSIPTAPAMFVLLLHCVTPTDPPHGAACPPVIEMLPLIAANCNV